MKSVYDQAGHRQQAAVNATENIKEILAQSTSLRFGVIYAVYTYDSVNNSSIPNNATGAYITYGVLLTPSGLQIDDIPALGSSSGHMVDNVTPNAPSITIQNSEETPYVIGQPVLVGFVNDSNFNAIIIGPAPCQLNSGSQSTLQYPQKQGTFQGTSWSIDKNGFPILNVVTNGKFKVEVNGTPFITVDGSTNTVDIGTGAEPGVLGTSLQNFLGTTLTNWLNTHTHLPGSFSNSGGPVAGVSGGPVSSPPATPTITTTVLKVQ